MLRIIGPSKRMNLRRKLSLDLPRRKYASTSTVVTVWPMTVATAEPTMPMPITMTSR